MLAQCVGRRWFTGHPEKLLGWFDATLISWSHKPRGGFTVLLPHQNWTKGIPNLEDLWTAVCPFTRSPATWKSQSGIYGWVHFVILTLWSEHTRFLLGARHWDDSMQHAWFSVGRLGLGTTSGLSLFKSSAPRGFPESLSNVVLCVYIILFLIWNSTILITWFFCPNEGNKREIRPYVFQRRALCPSRPASAHPNSHILMFTAAETAALP